MREVLKDRASLCRQANDKHSFSYHEGKKIDFMEQGWRYHHKVLIAALLPKFN
ncbi:hypothetical protein [Paenibacillus sp. 1011MAR3C5]|uniref:hypothetical protein n=1 Tax=Paenibacillus sp. 1011MAR3C5 TaxID=1675787 RepID=UPI00160124D2|nr:hypothetical protein [Paenibacillus sp. 1011MAR3C5]